MKRTCSLSTGAVVVRLLLLGFLALVPLPGTPVRAAAPVSCRAPADEAARKYCAALEEQVLDATVFLCFRVACGSRANQGQTLVHSHATVVDEQTVLTHDHYGWTNNPKCRLEALVVYSGRGMRLAEYEDPETLGALVAGLRPDPAGSRYHSRLLTFPEPLFVAANVTYDRVDGEPGADVLAGWGELAEVNWTSYPQQTYVQWVKPARLEVRGEALALFVQQPVKVGASGGGVFRVVNGQLHHVGNVWATRLREGTSVVALNQ